jgi:hypothetical protein
VTPSLAHDAIVAALMALSHVTSTGSGVGVGVSDGVALSVGVGAAAVGAEVGSRKQPPAVVSTAAARRPEISVRVTVVFPEGSVRGARYGDQPMRHRLVERSSS